MSRHAEGSLGAALEKAAQRLAEAQIETARLDARLLAAHAIGKDPSFCMAYPETRLSVDETHCLNALIARRSTREPMAHILGWREFWSLNFQVTADTLVPRPDTETVVDAALQALSDQAMSDPPLAEPARILDLGTGTGCLLISLLTEWRSATGVGIDINPGAVRVASDNAQRIGVAERAFFQTGDWFSGLTSPFDVIVSNPPYIPLGDRATLPKDVVDYDPHEALFAGSDGLDAYRILAAGAGEFLSQHGLVIIEIGAGQASQVNDLFMRHGFEMQRTHNDLAGIPRALVFRQKKRPSHKK